jgi:UDP-glucose 4-epimerase
MKILITGGAGFIGSHLSELLISEGNQVISLDNQSTGSVKNLNLSSNLEVIEGSILDSKLVDSLMSKVTVCFHLAAALGVKNIVEHPLESLETNIKGSEIVLNAATKYQVRTLLASSSEVYGKNPNQPLREDSDRVLGSPKVARWSYSEAKAIDEFYAFQLNKQKGLPVTIARLFNTVGPRQSGSYGMVLPRFVSAALSNQPLTVYGDGTQSRTFSAVSDVVMALNGLLKTKSTIGEVFNVGGNQQITILDLAKKVIEITNSNSQIEYKPYSEVYGSDFEEPNSRIPDISKIKGAINWSPQKGLDEIITELSDHMKKQS